MSEAYLPTTPADDSHYLLTGIRLINGTGTPSIDDAEVEVDTGMIVYAGPRRHPAAPETTESTNGEATSAGVQIFDLGGRTVLPGFIDAHVHFGLSIEDQNPARFHSEKQFRAAVNARNTLLAGVTTVRDLGGVDKGFRDAIEAGLFAGPRMHVALTPLSPTGGHSDHRLANGHPSGLEMPYDGIVDTDDQVRARVREFVHAGADLIKVCTTGGVSSPTDTPDDIGVPEEHVRLIVEEMAKRADQPVAAHAQGAEGIKAAIRGGVRSVEHGYNIDDEGIDLMLENGTFLVPTLSSALRVPDPAAVPGYLYEKKVRWSAIARERLTEAFAAGLKVALGTDSGVCPHGFNLRELGHAVELGMGPMDAIVAMTRNAAELLRLDEYLGTIETGKLADLVIVDVDPLTSIEALAEPENIGVVIQGGRIVKDSAGVLGGVVARSQLG